jgi:FemAB-related protein (PEP-CTERM system-associated)
VDHRAGGGEVTVDGVAVSVVVPITTTDIDVDALVRGYGDVLQRSNHPFELVFVLDGITGRVERELRAHAAAYPIKIVRLQGGGLGESIALSAGVDRAAGELVINAPQYLQTEPDDVLKVVQALENGADFVATWRTHRVDPWLNRVQSAIFNWCLRALMGIKFHDLNSSLRGLRRHVLGQINVYGELYRFLPVLAMRQGFRTVEVKVRHREEQGRKGFYGLGVYMRRVLDILAITFLTRFTQRPLRFFGMLGLSAILIGAALCAEPLFEKFVQGESSARPVLILGAVLLAFGVQLIGFGLVGEIIIFTQARNLRDYQIDEDLAEPPEPLAAAEPVPAATVDGAPLHVRELLPGEDARWDAFVQHHRHGSFFHLSGWRKVVEDTFRHVPHYLVAARGRQWEGVLPAFWVKSPFVGNHLISLPYAVYGGVLADSEEARLALLEAAAAEGRRRGAGYVELRHTEGRCPELQRSSLYVTFRKVLPDRPEAVMPAIPKKARAEVRRARDRFKLTFEESRDLDAFFTMFALNKRDLGTPSLPRRWFAGLLEEFGSAVVLHVVREQGGQPIAAVMSFCYGDTVCAYYSGSRREHNKTGVNDFVYCSIMEWATARGFRVFDFGRSRKETGAAAFKRNMGFLAEPLDYEYVLLGESAALPEFHPSNPRLRLPQRVWSNLPTFLTHRLGGRLSRYLP